MRRAVLLPLLIAVASVTTANGHVSTSGYIDYTIAITGARQLKTHARAPLSCDVLTQFGLRDDNGRMFGFQFDGITPCGEAPWTAERWIYDDVNAVAEVYIGVAGDEPVPALARARFVNNAKARTSITLRPNATGTIAFEHLINEQQEFVSGTIEFRVVK